MSWLDWDRGDEPRDWGGWVLDRERLVLDLYVDGSWAYEVDLEQCLTSAQVLDSIAQVSLKGIWGPEVVAGLVAALDDVLDLQRRLCSCGVPLEIDPEDLPGLVESAARGSRR